ncbi:hypothetical protein L6164_004390 [Bauhinia variegata]|uniref:Uncharacterized protein n=1 Tax=Bauhinia variegata TaxID=167791 RepID=A0ACB9Q9T7_BAUVA|nr:hypothetical protein L6164_004390 [Bauhinia variegata]
METTKEDSGWLHKILPPLLEDAGLEDCALPPDSIKEAFFKAAAAAKSRAASIFSGEDDDDARCVKDPWPTAEDASDAVVGMEPGNDPAGSYTVEKEGGIGGMGGEDIKVGGGVEVADIGDEVVVGEGGVKLGEEGKSCADELQGLKIEEDAKKGGGGEEEKKEDERPTLVEGFV